MVKALLSDCVTTNQHKTSFKYFLQTWYVGNDL